MAHTLSSASLTRSRIVNPTLLLVAVMWGASHVVMKWVLEVMEPAALLALRMGVLAVLMIGGLFIARRRPLGVRDRLMLVAVGGVLVAAQLLAFTYAMNMTTASEASLLVSTAPVWTAAMVALLRMELVTRLNWLGIAVASAGVAMIILGVPNGLARNAPARLSGDLLMIAAAWLYGGYMVLCRRWMRRFGELHVICHTFAAGGILLVIVGGRQLLATGWADITPGHWIGIAYVTLLAGCVGLVLWYRTIGRTSASGTAVYQYLVPGVAVIAAAIFLGERLTVPQLAGIAVTLVGVYLARVPPRSGSLGPARPAPDPSGRALSGDPSQRQT